MKRIICLLLSCSLLLTACSSNTSTNVSTETSEDVVTETSIEDLNIEDESNIVQEQSDEATANEVEEMAVVDGDESSSLEAEAPMDLTFKGLDDEALLDYVEDNIYEQLVAELNSEDYFVENVEAIYYPKEYIEALASNSRSNLYFGYTAEELDAQFQGTKYVFTLGADGQTIVVPMETLNDDIYVKAMEDVIIGTGVILICVTVSAVAAPAAPAVSMIFAASASTGTMFALESGGIGFIAAGIAKGYETESFEQAMKAAVQAGGESYKWGAVTGVITGGASEALTLKGMTINGLTMNEAALIQKESGWPIEAIKSLHSKEEYEIYKNVGLKPTKMNDGSWAMLRDIDWSLVDNKGRTNIERVRDYKIAPIDASGKSYDLHHIGMREDSPLAIMTYEEHHSKEWYKILHYKEEGKNISDAAWEAQKDDFWDAILEMAGVIE